MSRTLSSSMLRAIYAEETGDYPILLITITHPSLAAPLRISSDPTQRTVVTDEEVVYGTVSRAETFVFVPFSISLPNDSAEETPQTSITIDNVGREMVPTIRSLTSAPEITLEMVMASTPDVVEAVFPGFALSSVTYDAMSISGTLSVTEFTTEPCPAGTFNPAEFPGMF